MINRFKQVIRYILLRWKSILISALVLTILLGVVARIIAPPGTNVQTPRLPITEALAGPVRVDFDGDPNLPQRLRLFRSTSYLPTLSLADQIVRQLNLSRHQVVGSLYVSQDEAVSLTIESGLEVIEYNASVGMEDLVTLDRATDLATAFLIQVGFPTGQMRLRPEETRYFSVSGLEDFEEVDPTQAQVIELSFIRDLNGYPTVISSTPTSEIRMLVTNEGVLRAPLISLVFTTEVDQEVPLMSMDEILDEIRAGNYLILGTIDVIDPSEPGNALNSLRLTRQQLEYRLDPNQSLFIPFVQFSGTTTLQNGDVLPIVITTPAIRTVPALQ